MSNQGRAGFTMIDNTAEKSVFSMNVGIVTAASLPGLLTNLGQFETALEAVVLTNIFKKRLLVYDNSGATPVPPASTSAQVEKKWLVHYHDSQELFGAVPNVFFGNKYTCEIAGADEALLVSGTDFMNITTGVGATFKTEFESCFLAPSGGTLVVDSVEFV